MKLTIAKITFVTFFCWSTRILSTANDVYFAIENYMDESLQYLCNDDISLNFSNAVISEIKRDFISSPVITCLNLMNNSIEKIGRGAFEKLPNLTQLFLSNNRLRSKSEFLDFGSHDKLQVLIMNYASYFTECYNDDVIQIFGEYPNLEILSLRKNCFNDLVFVQENPFMKSHFTYTTPMTSQNWMPFPKLKILDLSENNMRRTNFVQLLSNSLYFLDLHGNSLSNLNLNEKGKKLFALNLDENNFNNIQQYNGYSKTLSMAGLKNLHYLSVSRNEINTIESDAFRDNNELLFLNLSSNDIHYLHPKTFANLQYLETLDLSINQLENVPEISNETEISTLYINNNNIKKIISHTFVHMPKLMKLLMGNNQINNINVNAFARLIVLEELDLSKNMLSSLPERWTESLVSLKYLDLSDNKFTSLESLSLTNMLPLITVYLKKNSLEYLNVKYFENLPQNLTIDLIN